MAPITFVTGNLNKLKEFKAIVEDDSIVHQKIDLEEIQGSIEEISKKKAKAAAIAINGPVLVEDTCLVFNALTKPGIELPGPYIKWFLDSMGVEDLPKLLVGFEDKSAQAVCTFAYCEGPGSEPQLFQGINDGVIVEKPRFHGDSPFGWDPIFQPAGYSETYGEMDKAVKNTMSHRYQSLMLVKEFLKNKQ